VPFQKSVHLAKEQHKELANCIEGMLSGQRSLISLDPKIERHAKRAVQRILERRSREEAIDQFEESSIDEPPDYQCVDIASFEADLLRSIGPEYVCHCVWKDLKIEEVLLSNGVSKNILPLIETLVVGRLVAPGSEVNTLYWAQNRSAIFELTDKPLRYSMSSFYRAADSVFKCKDALEAHLARMEKDIFNLSETMVFLT